MSYTMYYGTHIEQHMHVVVGKSYQRYMFRSIFHCIFFQRIFQFLLKQTLPCSRAEYYMQMAWVLRTIKMKIEENKMEIL